ncbi:MAG: hypothetical protein JNJ98_03675 [Gemmatimonadetes bacterium]|nr:hypothetical protein [Gemmatimonadota bacterium]
MNASHVTDPEVLRARALALHQNVQGALQEQFHESLQDLQQLRSLLGDATGKLSAAFQTMIHQAKAQRAAADALEQVAGVDAVREVKELAEEITRGSLMVVQSLQFEDMATQLLTHVDRRLSWLEAYAREAAPLHTAVSGEVVGITRVDFAAVEQRLADRQQEKAAWSRKAVQQESLDEGDIELF